jgi:hypothetical protein
MDSELAAMRSTALQIEPQSGFAFWKPQPGAEICDFSLFFRSAMRFLRICFTGTGLGVPSASSNGG